MSRSEGVGLMTGRRLPVAGGQSEGTVPRRARINSGDPKGAADRKSSAPGALLTIQDVADHTQVSYWTARGWIESGKLPALRLPGRLIRIRPSALERFLETECQS
jgi:excisionase family DNA binding protein